MKKWIIVTIAIVLIIVGLLTSFIFFKDKNEITYRITINYNSDDNSSETIDINDINALKEKLIFSIKDKNKEGFVFVYWKYDGKPINTISNITNDMTIDAVWEPEKEDNLVKINDLSNIYRTNLNEQKEPADLLVLIFNYKNDYYEMPDEKLERMWSDYLFGNPETSVSINDYFKEISNNQFYFNKVLLGDNKTGVYSFHIDKEYDRNNFEDISNALNDLVEKGLNLDPYLIVHDESVQQTDLYDLQTYGGYDVQPAQWFSTSKIMVVYPPYNMERVAIDRITIPYPPDYALIAEINYDSSFGTIAHELVHTLGAMDVYNYGSFGSDLMSDQYPILLELGEEYNTLHINPYYKMLFGWIKPTIIEGQGKVTLYPQNSNEYNPIIIKTDNNDQYYIIENRIGYSFDKVDLTNSEGINIWRIDKLGVEAIRDKNRKGIVLEGLLTKNDQVINLFHYKDNNNISDIDLESKGIKITYLEKNADGSIDIKISR